MEQSVKAVVESVRDGPHGLYVIATTKAFEGSITFSLQRNVWLEQGHPEPGEIVFLSELREKRLGWRAKKGRYWKLSDEQTARRETIMKNLKVLVQELRSKWFPTEEDKTWKQWVDYKRRESGDLIKLLASDVRDSFKKRALFLLLVPSADFNPIYWTQEVGKFYHRLDLLNTLSLDLLVYVAEVVTKFCELLRPMFWDRPENVVEGGGGLMVFMQIPDKYHDALCFYNNCILSLLILLPTEQAEKIFPLLSLRDISTYSNMENESGYTPFKHLLYSERIDEKWKKAADAAMRQIILSETSGDTRPREKWENALRCYANIVQSQLYGDKLILPVEFFADQIQFIMDNRQQDSGLIENWDVIKIFHLLPGDVYKDLRHTISRYAVLEEKGEYSGYTVYSGETLDAANQMLDEFGDSDPELVAKLEALIEEGEEKQTQSAAYQATQKETEAGILAQMK